MVHPYITSFTIIPGSLFTQTISNQECNSWIYPGDTVMLGVAGFDYNNPYINNKITIDDAPIQTTGASNFALTGIVPLLLYPPNGGIEFLASGPLQEQTDGIDSINSYPVAVPTVTTTTFFCDDIPTALQDVVNLVNTNCGPFMLGSPLCSDLVKTDCDNKSSGSYNPICGGLNISNLKELILSGAYRYILETCPTDACGNWGRNGTAGPGCIFTNPYTGKAMNLLKTCKQMYQFATQPNELLGLATFDGRPGSAQEINAVLSLDLGLRNSTFETSLELNSVQISFNPPTSTLPGSLHFAVDADITLSGKLAVYFYNKYQVCSKVGYTCACLFGACACFNYPELYNCAGYDPLFGLPIGYYKARDITMKFDMVPQISTSTPCAQPVQWTIENFNAGMGSFIIDPVETAPALCATLASVIPAVAGPESNDLVTLGCMGVENLVDTAMTTVIPNLISNNQQKIQDMLSPLLNLMVENVHDFYDKTDTLGSLDSIFATQFSFNSSENIPRHCSSCATNKCVDITHIQ